MGAIERQAQADEVEPRLGIEGFEHGGCHEPSPQRKPLPHGGSAIWAELLPPLPRARVLSPDEQFYRIVGLFRHAQRTVEDKWPRDICIEKPVGGFRHVSTGRKLDQPVCKTGLAVDSVVDPRSLESLANDPPGIE